MKSARGSISIFKMKSYKTLHVCACCGAPTRDKVEVKYNRPGLSKVYGEAARWLQYAALCGAPSCRATLRKHAWVKAEAGLPCPYESETLSDSVLATA